MTIYRDDAKAAPNKMSSWMRDFADYWKDAEGRIKNADYLSQIQKALNKDRRSVSEAVGDLRNRVGLDAVENLKKESENEGESKNAAQEEQEEVKQGLPNALEEDQHLMNKVMAMIRAQPFISVEALKAEFSYADALEDEEVEKYLEDILERERSGKTKEKDQKINYSVDHVDTSDNKFLNYDQDVVNKI